ncbi:hypothetical protein GCM10020366_07560 [Saccharopolyspora gregorii]|uniref:Cation:dicarboxylase symporter family transporter n=2 Tax=Saccharopolyspora gregorii TaxID=33914 RepID=A0ABP6RJZ1_9PSEU
MISPVIFCTIVLGVGGVRQAAKVGKVGGLALGYFLVMSFVALVVGLLVGNVLHPGEGLQLTDELRASGSDQAPGEPRACPGSSSDHPEHPGLRPHQGEVLQTLLVALLAGFAPARPSATRARRSCAESSTSSGSCSRSSRMVMWVAPIGAVRRDRRRRRRHRVDALKGLGVIMAGFYITCLLFIFLVLGPLLWAFARVSVFKLLGYLGREFLLILSTSSSEAALPRLIAKMEHLGVSKPVVCITVPTGTRST